MGDTVIVIGGKDVVVPNAEIPRVIDELTVAYTKQMRSSTAEASPRDGYVTYQICEKALERATGDSGRTLRARTGNLWGAICRMTKCGKLHYETICDRCGGKVEDRGGPKRTVCQHPHATTGFRLVSIRCSSILDNAEQFCALKIRKRDSIKRDYLYLLAELNTIPL